MTNWKAIPFVRLIIPLVLGIFLGNMVSIGVDSTMLLIPIGLLLLLGILAFRRLAFSSKWIYGLVLNVTIILMGFSWMSFYPEINRQSHFGPYIEGQSYYIGTVSRPPVHKKRTNAVLSIRLAGAAVHQLNQVTGRLYASFPRDSTIQYGDQYILNTRPKEIPPPANPNAFDFKQYQYYQNIHYQCFLNAGDWKKMESQKGNIVLLFAYRMRGRFQQVLKRSFRTENEIGFASAFVLGIRDELSQETRAAFAKTGAMHVLAVSGLHVGIVSMGLRVLLLFLLGKGQRVRWIRLGIQLLGVWFFVLMTGAGPAVLRAGLMFSLIAIGLAGNRHSNIFNSIAASAFILLIFNPLLLFQVGFQLSYLALTGIIFFQPIFYKLIYIKNPVVDFLWKMMTVSMGAQLTTLPLSVFYFHQFPLSFILSSLIVVPAAIVLLPLTILVFIIDLISIQLGTILGQGLYYLYHTINWIIESISQIEWMTLGNLNYSRWTVVMLLAIILLAMTWIETKNKKWIFPILFIITGLSIERILLTFQAENQEFFVTYKLSKKTYATDFVSGRTANRITNAPPDSKTIQWATKNFHIKKGISKTNYIKGDTILKNFATIDHITLFGHHIIELADDRVPISRPFHTDYLWVTEDTDVKWIEAIHPSFVLLDASLSYRTINQLEKFCASKNIPVSNLKKDGAVMIKN